MAQPLPRITETSTLLLKQQQFSNGVTFDSHSEFLVKMLPSCYSKHLESERFVWCWGHNDEEKQWFPSLSKASPLDRQLLASILDLPCTLGSFQGLTLNPWKDYGHSQPFRSQSLASHATMVSFQMQTSQVFPPTGPQRIVHKGFIFYLHLGTSMKNQQQKGVNSLNHYRGQQNLSVGGQK